MVSVINSSSGDVTFTFSVADPTMCAAAPLASGVPTVRKFEACVGGLQDGKASGEPWVLFGAVHCLKAGTSETRSGLAPFGRGCDAPATWLRTRTPRAQMPSATGNAVFHLVVMTSPFPVMAHSTGSHPDVKAISAGQRWSRATLGVRSRLNTYSVFNPARSDSEAAQPPTRLGAPARGR